ncbi:hypothetical protein SERLADRAFT_461800 [Serpula lacrymans var. lacrymans S7.9]|uniref:Uncharacterized protein n=1 Tax=Serpula lacrymans var. lacrymans (strain S7.9) TaxID=578457 RepID=F8NPX8_SERL9|nr:uncharacterized protein SERLADRAFT_461800 [Serpula lacrymans var. lacrymans S7.9]EGO27766.1 hypothetical protein SERLADRAFT_461800 [Serpula lacrymans var. lacrymans S7.9]
MDDDLTFGASVWGIPSDPTRLSNLTTDLPTFSSPSTSQDLFDDFDDFHTPPQTDQAASSVAQDDDFGDFGDFGEAEELANANDFEQDTRFEEEIPIAGPSQLEWEPLVMNPVPSNEELGRQISNLLESVWTQDVSGLTMDQDLRQVDGISQMLVTSQSRDLYNTLLNSPPSFEPINWTRSRIRQQHLISLGLPVNLDEVFPHANGKPLPPLQISTRPMSAPPGPRNGPLRSTPPSRSNSRANSPRKPSARSGPTSVSQLGLGPKPVLDEKKVNDLLNLDPNQLPLLPLAKLERFLADLRAETTNTSTLLTHLLQTRDALQQDSETYNKLIAELVSEAQKPKSGKGRTSSRRSVMAGS